MKFKFPCSISCSLTNFIWIASIVPMLKLVNLHTVVIVSIKILLHSLHCMYFRCSKFNQMLRIWFHFAFHFYFKTKFSLLTEFSWIRFSNRDLKTLYWQLYWDNWNACIISFYQLCKNSVSLILRNYLNL